MGRGGASGGWRGSDEHLMLVNAPVQEKPDAPGFAELVHLRALNALKSPRHITSNFFSLKTTTNSSSSKSRGRPRSDAPLSITQLPNCEAADLLDTQLRLQFAMVPLLTLRAQLHHIPVACIGCYCCGGCVSE